MKARIVLCVLSILGIALVSTPSIAQQMTFTALRNSSSTFKTDAPLETIVGTTAGGAVSGTLTGDPSRPQAATGTIRVDLSTIKTGIERRDADMRSKDYLDTENEANRFAVFVLKEVEIGGPLDPGKETPAKLKGTLTIKGKPADITADARITYIKIAPDQLETQKRWGFTSDNIRVRAKFNTSFTNHGMQVPQLLILKVSNDIQLETDLTLVRQ